MAADGAGSKTGMAAGEMMGGRDRDRARERLGGCWRHCGRAFTQICGRPIGLAINRYERLVKQRSNAI